MIFSLLEVFKRYLYFDIKSLLQYFLSLSCKTMLYAISRNPSMLYPKQLRNSNFSNWLICHLNSSKVIILYKIILMLHQSFSRFSRVLCRFSSVYPSNIDLSSARGTFKAADLQKFVKKDLFPLPQFKAEALLFGKNNTDHMIEVDWEKETGWGVPKLIPFEPLKLHPFSSTLHYGIQCFEGMKAYKNDKGQIRLFRPECNAMRLKRSSQRLTLPDFDGKELIKLIAELVKTEQRWIPPTSQFSLYLRPLHIATDNALGVHSPSRSKLLIMAGPVGPYYPTGFKPISLSCATDTIRSAPKGTGAFKIGGNYAPTLLASSNVALQGHQQALWLLGNKIIEVGSSNIFFVFNDNGKIEIVTPALEDLILPGVTRDSILAFLRSQNLYKVTERVITIDQVIERHQKNQLVECFGAGTAVIVSGVKNIEYKGTNYNIPVDEKLQIGPVTHRIRNGILEIQQGRAQDKMGWTYRVK